MQKVLRINLNARNQALQKARRKHLKELRQKWAEHDDHRVVLERETRNMIKTERKERREDWIAGPLAPRRDVGLKNGIYGTLNSQFMRGPDVPDALSKWPRSKGDDLIGDDWKGKGNEGNLVEGDRVCVVRGADAILGQIGTIKDVFRERREITIEGFNTADLQVPAGQPGRKQRPFMAMNMPIPIDDVRLVFRNREEDPATGRLIRDRDVLVDSIQGDAPYFQREPGSSLPRHTRYIAGSNIEIPWPEVDVHRMSAFPGDTRRLELERRTYTPSVQRDPLPRPSILDELRPKYRIDRMEHEYDYVRRKIVEDARSKWYEERGINTPAMELQQKLREKSKLRAEQRQSEEVAFKIQILREEGRLKEFLPSYREKLIRNYKHQGVQHPELRADINALAYQNNSLSGLVHALETESSSEKSLSKQEMDQLLEDLGSEEAAEDQDSSYGGDWEKEVVVHEAPTNPRQ